MQQQEELIAKSGTFWSNGFIARMYRRYAKRYFGRMQSHVIHRIDSTGATRVLDIACGPGDFLAALSAARPSFTLAGTDIAPGMVAHARARLGGEITITETPADRQPFEDSSFDTVVTTMAFHHFPKLEVLKEVRRILVPGGTYFIADTVASSTMEKRLWNALERLTGIRGYVDHYTEQDIREWSDASGFENFSSERIPGMARRYRLVSLSKPK